MQAAAFKQQLPEWSVFTDLPVIPPDLRTSSEDDMGGTGDDLNNLYRALVKANIKVMEALLSSSLPEPILRYQKGQLQYAADCLIDNGRVSEASKKSTGTALESVAMRLKGKQGRMRDNMLGKRVDYSARTVIVVDPTLKLDRCGLPFSIAKEIFSGFLLYELTKHEDAVAAVDAIAIAEDRFAGGGITNRWRENVFIKWFDEQPQELQWELLTKAIGERRVLLNRAPTLHRLSIQAFHPQLTDGQALKIHPLVCSPFNADFDGDTMTVHLALGDKAQQELRELMMPSRNLSSPATGDPVIGPTQDMVLGLYYLTSDPLDPEAAAEVLSSAEEVEAAAKLCAAGQLSHHAAYLIKRELLVAMVPEAAAEDDPVLNGMDSEAPAEELGEELIRTTAGRLLFFLMLHQGFSPDIRLHMDLLDSLDSAPLAVQ